MTSLFLLVAALLLFTAVALLIRSIRQTAEDIHLTAKVGVDVAGRITAVVAGIGEEVGALRNDLCLLRAAVKPGERAAALLAETESLARSFRSLVAAAALLSTFRSVRGVRGVLQLFTSVQH